MTPQLLQAIKLLQLSHLDLATYVEIELERNPLLVQAEGSDGRDRRFSEASTVSVKGERGADAKPAETPSRDGESYSTTDAGYGRSPSTSTHHSKDFDQGVDFAASLAAQVPLADHLERQLEVATGDPQERAIGRHLIHSLDDAGYLGEDLAEIASRLGIPEARAERSLALLQTFDPPGIGARDLAECLAIQLREQDRYDPAMQALLTRLDLVARRDLAGLKRVCGVDDEDLVEMLAEIRRLEPKPGLAFGAPSPEFLVPDVLVRPASDGGWLIELNPDTLPRILIDQSYYVRLSRSARSDQDKAFLNECLQNANWLRRSLDQRATTILKVAAEIVRQQDGFFRNGVSHLRPLTLRAVADAIGMHESTISRVAANKSFGTNRGLFEMKYFFKAAIAGADGNDSHSSESVRHRIRQLVDSEPADDVLSDDAIARKLKSEGVDIARRTIAKYRESLRIPSSADRRRAKRA